MQQCDGARTEDNRTYFRECTLVIDACQIEMQTCKKGGPTTTHVRKHTNDELRKSFEMNSNKKWWSMCCTKSKGTAAFVQVIFRDCSLFDARLQCTHNKNKCNSLPQDRMRHQIG